MLVRVIDHALAECFRSDQKWRREKAKFRGGRDRPPQSGAGALGARVTVPVATERPTEPAAGSPEPAAKAS
ncbi:MAG TPA: hypothetical protein VFG23_12640 [Polyangia bacterium]|nr:hypothetical protein [Polyangia bacterium]